MMKELGYYDESFNATLQASDGDLSSYSFHMADQGTDAMEREKQFLFASQEGRYLWHMNRRSAGCTRAREVRHTATSAAGDRLRAARRAAARAALHHLQGERGRWQAPLSRRGALRRSSGGAGHRGRSTWSPRLIAEATLAPHAGSRRCSATGSSCAWSTTGRGVRAAPRALLALDLPRASRSSRCSSCAGCPAARPPGDRFRQLALGLVAGGAAGNLVDRIRSRAGVVDFLDVGIGALRWPTFNVADIGGELRRDRCSRSRCGGGLADGAEPESRPRPDAGADRPFSVRRRHTERLDRFLADQLGLSRTQAARLVADKARDGRIGRPARASRLLARGERVDVEIPDDAATPHAHSPHAIPLTRRVRGRAPRW